VQKLELVTVQDCYTSAQWTGSRELYLEIYPLCKELPAFLFENGVKIFLSLPIKCNEMSNEKQRAIGVMYVMMN
jgi:hypothetical protein